MLAPYFDFLRSLGTQEFVRLFWFFLVFELPRYVILDYVAILAHYLHRRSQGDARADARRNLFLEKPLVSVIVPGKDEGENFYQLARTLQEQTYQNYELIVVDDGSEDDSALIGRDLEEKGTIDVFLRKEVRGGKASAANLCLRYARGEYVVHLDADCSLDRDALERLLIPLYLDEKVGAVGGSLGVRNRKTNLCTMLQSIEYYLDISVGRLVSSTFGILGIVSGAFGAYRRNVLMQVGGWDVGPGEDSDMTLKIRKAGYRIFFAPHAVSLTDVPTTFRKLSSQRLRWQRSLISLRLRKHRSIFAPDENFSFLNFLYSFNNIFYSLLLSLFWTFYLLDIVFNFTHLIGFIFVTVFILYTASRYIEFGGFLLIAKYKKSKLPLLLYVPLMALYTGYYLRIVRLVAYFSEFFFKSSYKDPFSPAKASREARKHGF